MVVSSQAVLFVIERSAHLGFPGLLKQVISLPKFLNCRLVKNSDKHGLILLQLKSPVRIFF